MNNPKLVEKIVFDLVYSKPVTRVKNGQCNELLYGTCTHKWDCTVQKPEGVHAIVNAGASRVGNALGACEVTPAIACAIDHTLLKPEATREQIIQLCSEAREYGFASVCINPGWVRTASALLKGSKVRICTVIGFPLGATDTASKVNEALNAIASGATELDMVINVGYLKSGMISEAESDIQAVVDAVSCHPVMVKVIIETGLLSDEEKVIACILAKNAGAHFVKTSTGFAKGGATVQDVALMRKVVGQNMGVKASGGVRSLADAEKMVAAGATRIGASASVEIVHGEKSEAVY